MINVPYITNRKITTVFIHCSASDYQADDNIDKLRKLHSGSPKESVVWGDRKINCFGWSDIGYHYFINKDAKILKGRSLSKVPSAQQGYNTGSIAVCVSGLEDFNKNQFSSLVELCDEIQYLYPEVTFHGHCEVNPIKTCPVFNYKKVLKLDRNGSRKLKLRPGFSELYE